MSETDDIIAVAERRRPHQMRDQQVRRRKPLSGANRRKPFAGAVVSGRTDPGSGYSTAICVKYGFDPHETWIGEEVLTSLR